MQPRNSGLGISIRTCHRYARLSTIFEASDDAGKEWWRRKRVMTQEESWKPPRVHIDEDIIVSIAVYCPKIMEWKRNRVWVQKFWIHCWTPEICFLEGRALVGSTLFVVSKWTSLRRIQINSSPLPAALFEPLTECKEVSRFSSGWQRVQPRYIPTPKDLYSSDISWWIKII